MTILILVVCFNQNKLNTLLLKGCYDYSHTWCQLYEL